MGMAGLVRRYTDSKSRPGSYVAALGCALVQYMRYLIWCICAGVRVYGQEMRKAEGTDIANLENPTINETAVGFLVYCSSGSLNFWLVRRDFLVTLNTTCSMVRNILRDAQIKMSS